MLQSEGDNSKIRNLIVVVKCSLSRITLYSPIGAYYKKE